MKKKEEEEEVEVEKDCEEGIEESEAGNETVLGQSWGEREEISTTQHFLSLSLTYVHSHSHTHTQ